MTKLSKDAEKNITKSDVTFHAARQSKLSKEVDDFYTARNTAVSKDGTFYSPDEDLATPWNQKNSVEVHIQSPSRSSHSFKDSKHRKMRQSNTSDATFHTARTSLGRNSLDSNFTSKFCIIL